MTDPIATADAPTPPPLEAKSPYELRVDYSKHVSENVFKHALETGDIGFMHSFTTGSTVDGPGVRVVGWLAGCHWRCKFCHNPDTWSMTNGIPVPIEKAISEVSRYKRGLSVMSGGLTITGGEPLLQDRFCVRLFAGAKKQKIHTVLNSNGALHARISDAEFNDIDLVIMDLKTWGDDRHLALTTKEMGPTLECAQRLAAMKKPMWVRTVVIPGWTDDPAIIEGIATFAVRLGNVERIDVLPFHQMGRYKWHKLGLEYAMENVTPPPPESVKRVCEQFQSHGLNAV